MQKCIEKIGFLIAKIVPMNGGGVAGLVGSFSAYAEMRKEFQQVPDFQRFALFRKSFRILSAMRKTLDFQRFANIKQVLISQRFYASFGAGQGVGVGC